MRSTDTPTRRHRWQVPPIRHWTVWSLPPLTRAYVIAVPAVAAVALAVAATRTQWRVSQLGVFFLLLASAAAMVEATRDVKLPRDTVTRDLQEVWYLSIAVLLPPVYALLAPIPLTVMKQWRVRHNLVHRRVFSSASNGLGYGAAAVEFHGGFQPVLGGLSGGVHSVGLLGAIVAAAATGWAINVWLVVGAVKLTVPGARIRALMLTREAVTTDTVVTCLASLVAFALSFSLAAAIVAVPVVLMQKRFLMHSQLVAEARTDPKTGLLNAVAWQREAEAWIRRSRRAGAPAALLLVDIDHFKRVNDTYGHLAGDELLTATAHTLVQHVQAGDVLGRFGGEEFVIVAPGAGERDACGLAERLREEVGSISVPARGELVTVTVSIGVAALGRDGYELFELLAAADAALYRAKKAGRDRVCTLPPGACPSDPWAGSP